MPGANLEATFGVRTLTAVVQEFANNSLDQFCTSYFKQGRQVAPEGRTFDWDEVQFHRHLAPVTGPQSPFINLEQATRINKTAALAHIKLFKDLPGDRLFYDRAPGTLRPNAAAVVAIELRDLQNAIMKTIEWMCINTLLGSLVVNATNVPGTELPFTVTYATNVYTKTNPWATAATAILSAEIPAMVASYVQAAGMLPAQALMNDVTERNFIANTEVQGWARQQFGGDFLKSSSVDPAVISGLDLGGLKWRKSPGGYVPQGGSFTRYIPSQQIVVLPDSSFLPDVLGFAQGFGIIPRTAFGAESGQGLVELAPSPGFYAYSSVQENPAGLRLYAGWVGLPYLMFPAGVTVANV